MQYISHDKPATPKSAHCQELRDPKRLKGLDRDNTLARFEKWCEMNGVPYEISRETYRGFESSLFGVYAPTIAKQKLRYLYEFGIQSHDLKTRDYFFENFPDLRTDAEIVAGATWTHLTRLFASGLETSQRSRVLRELDNFFRWQGRTAEVAPSLQLGLLFLTEGSSERTKYQRLSRLCLGLEAVQPGCRDLPRLRAWQHVLYNRVWPATPTPISTARRLEEVEALLLDRRHFKTGNPISEKTKEAHRRALMLHSGIMKQLGRGLAFDRNALDAFADHVLHMLAQRHAFEVGEASSETGTKIAPGWSDVTAWSMCERLGPYIPDQALRSKWYSFTQHLKNEARKRGQIKRKEQALSDRPMTLETAFRRTHELCGMADAEINVQTRHGLFAVIGALGILLFYPLRRADLVRLRIGHELILQDGRWFLAPQFAQKTGSAISQLILPEEAGNLIEFCILRGGPRAQLSERYEQVRGRPLLVSPRRTVAYEEGAFSTLFARWMTHRTHIFRSIWCDHLIELGADRTMISIMLQHKSLISQDEYEILAGKIRQIKVMNKLHELAHIALVFDEAKETN